MSLKQKINDEIKADGIAALYFGCWIVTLLLFEHVSLGTWVRARPARVDVVLRTAMCTLGVAVVLALEKGFEGRHEYGGFAQALRQLYQQEDVHHVWINTIVLSGALLGYNALSVLRYHLGKGGLIRMFLSPLPKEEK